MIPIAERAKPRKIAISEFREDIPGRPMAARSGRRTEDGHLISPSPSPAFVSTGAKSQRRVVATCPCDAKRSSSG
ncbi:hypothetical protein GCM10010104_25700 [Streptomyces indiaensis]|uniref:Uncharacterized protein n=1 Tax=Streptomyces indiaensis TaxID=284033 RepID=A0ABN3DHG0_9ACTN